MSISATMDANKKHEEGPKTVFYSLFGSIVIRINIRTKGRQDKI